MTTTLDKVAGVGILSKPAESTTNNLYFIILKARVESKDFPFTYSSEKLTSLGGYITSREVT